MIKYCELKPHAFLLAPGHFYTGLVPQSFSYAVAEEGKGFCLEAEGQSWCCPKVPYKWSLLMSRVKGGIELIQVLRSCRMRICSWQDALSPQLLAPSPSALATYPEMSQTRRGADPGPGKWDWRNSCLRSW